MDAMAVLTIVVVASLVLAGTVLATDNPAGPPAGKPARLVTLRFWGHACFTLTADGRTVLIDPFSPKVGYKPFDVEPDLVLISHEHFDHNDTSWLKGKPLVLHGLDDQGQVQQIDRRVGPFRVRTVAAQHWSDPANQQRGNNAIFVIEVSGLRIVHAGDLGRTLDARQVQAIGPVDVLLVPVGGFFTIDADQAYAAAQELQPRAYVVPMHYRTAALDESLRSRLAEPTPFLRKFGENTLRPEGNELTIDPANLPAERQAVLMNYRPAAPVPPNSTMPAGKP